MKIAVFYENIAEGAKALCITNEEAFTRLKAEGLTSIYLSSYSILRDWDNLSPIFEKLGLDIEGVYGFTDFAHNPTSGEGRDVIDVAARVGARNVLIVPGTCQGKPEEMPSVVQNIIAGMTDSAAYGKEKGIPVSMEDFDGLDAPYCTLQGLRQFMDAIPDLCCSYDTGNFVMYHEDSAAGLELFLDRLCTMHLKDRSETPVHPTDKCKTCADGAPTYPAPVGSGTIRMDAILKRLKESGYQGNVIVELFDTGAEYMLDAAIESLRWLRERV